MKIDETQLETAKARAATMSVATNVGLFALKLVAALLTGSISLFSEVVHSLTDMIASVLAFASVKAAAAPPDDQHPYGHGKIESLAAFIESLLLAGIVVVILVEAIPRFAHPDPIRSPMAGIVVMALSSLVCFFTGRFVLGVGTQTESAVLESNGRHLTIDSVTSAGVLMALVITKVSGFAIADPMVACLIAAWIAYNAWITGSYAFNQLIDQRITDSDLKLILDILNSDSEAISYHRLLTRHSGSHHYVQVHVVVPREYSVVEGHAVADRLEKRIEQTLRPAHVVIHVDPLEPGKVAEPIANTNLE